MDVPTVAGTFRIERVEVIWLRDGKLGSTRRSRVTVWEITWPGESAPAATRDTRAAALAYVQGQL